MANALKTDSKVRDELLRKYSSRSIASMKVKHPLKIISWDFAIKLSSIVKRSIDIMAALILIVLLSPVFLITSTAIFMEDRGYVFYAQKRVGRNGKHFEMLKFRSMMIGAEKIKESLLAQNESGDGVTFKMKNDPRITKVGRFIRKFSIDELPQLLNVLKGNMSLVGPRPPLPKEVAEYTLEDRKRLHVIPGITCIWQVSGRSDIPFKQQVQLDTEYIRSQSLATDIKLLLKTIPAVLLGKGGY